MITAKLYNLRIAPRKVRLVADLIRGKSAEEAVAILNFTVKKSVNPIIKLLNSALASAKNNLQLGPANLYISRITVDEGLKLKRWRARARGSASTILKRTSHINLVLDEIKKTDIIEKKTAVNLGERRSEEFGQEEKVEKIKSEEKPKLKPEIKISAPKTERGIKRIFRRKVF